MPSAVRHVGSAPQNAPLAHLVYPTASAILQYSEEEAVSKVEKELGRREVEKARGWLTDWRAVAGPSWYLQGSCLLLDDQKTLGSHTSVASRDRVGICRVMHCKLKLETQGNRMSLSFSKNQLCWTHSLFISV